MAACILTSCVKPTPRTHPQPLTQELTLRGLQSTISSSDLVQEALELINYYTPWQFKKPPTLGIEVEGLVPDKPALDNYALANLIKQQISTQHVMVNILASADNQVQYYRAHQPTSKLDELRQKTTPPYLYKLVTEASVSPPPDWRSLELVSPILRDQQDLNTFYHVLTHLHTKARFTAAPMIAGVHVHIGFEQARIEELLLLGWLFALVEDQVYQRFRVFKSRDKWAAQTSKHTQEIYRSKLQALQQMKAQAKTPPGQSLLSPYQAEAWRQELLNSTDNHGLNFVNLDSLQTLEFRFANSTTHIHQIKALVQFVTALVRAVRSQDKKLIELLTQHHNSADATLSLDKLLAALGLELDASLFQHQQVDELYQNIHPLKTRRLYQKKHLHLAVRSGDAELTRLLLKYSLDLQTFNEHLELRDPEGDLVHKAIRSGSVATLKLLLRQSLKLKPHQHYTYWLAAMGSGQLKMLQYLVAQGLSYPRKCVDWLKSKF